jgi:succinyl-CoA synthetase beta subunit
MKLKEHEGKEIFKEYGLKVPGGYVVSDVSEVKAADKDVVVKSQVLVGSRKKSGGIEFASKEKVKDVVAEMLGREINGLKVEEVLIEEKLNIEKEMFLSLTIDRFEKKVKVLFSEEGGIDIEGIADKVLKLDVDGLDKLDENVKEVAEILYKIMKDYDAELVEINPLVIADGELAAADSKIIVDDNALFRHLELAPKNRQCYAEERASVCGFNYVELGGDIAVIGNGAGLVMATLDVLNYYGGKPADFLDVGGGADVKRMENAMDAVLSNNPTALLVNIFGGITRCDEIAQGIVNYRKDKGVEVPMVVRLIGTNEEEGKKILHEGCIVSLDSMEDCVKAVVEASKK